MANPKNDLYYTAALLEYTARKTKNARKYIAETVGVNGIAWIYRFADVSHCLTFEETSDELISRYGIKDGNFCPEEQVENPPRFLAIGKNYARIVFQEESDPKKYPETLYHVLCSKVSEWMSNYHSAFFYSTPEYQWLRYKEVKDGKDYLYPKEET